MFRLAWTTDPHLLHAEDSDLKRLAKHIELAEPDYWVIGGDISNARTLVEKLELLVSMCKCPVGFVLGNHDYYGSSRDKVRMIAREFSESQSAAKWLPLEGVVPLTSEVALVGVDGWADGRNGDGIKGQPINDFGHIEDLRGDATTRMRTLARFSDEETSLAQRLLEKAFEVRDKVVFVTHIPPFAEASWHQGAMSEPSMLPWFSSRGMGEMLLGLMRRHPDKQCTVLCGHTHGGGTYQAAENLKVITGPAEYGDPIVQDVFFLEGSVTLGQEPASVSAKGTNEKKSSKRSKKSASPK